MSFNKRRVKILTMINFQNNFYEVIFKCHMFPVTGWEGQGLKKNEWS